MTVFSNSEVLPSVPLAVEEALDDDDDVDDEDDDDVDFDDDPDDDEDDDEMSRTKLLQKTNLILASLTLRKPISSKSS